MSRTTKTQRAPGKELWSRRPVSNYGGCDPTADNKRRTHRIERRAAKTTARALLAETQEGGC